MNPLLQLLQRTHRQPAWTWASFAFLVLAAMMLLLPPPSLHAQSGDPQPGQVLVDEREAQSIDRMIMCPVCPAETIDQAQVEISFQMRAVVRDMLAQGKSRQEILDFFVERYGPDILAAPPKSGVNLLAWILPIVAVAAGLVGVWFVIRSMTDRKRALSYKPVTRPGEGRGDARIEPYLTLVDQHLSRMRGQQPGRQAGIIRFAGEEQPDANSEALAESSQAALVVKLPGAAMGPGEVPPRDG